MTIVDELRKDRENGAKRLESEYRAGLMTLARRFCSDEGDAAELVNRTMMKHCEGMNADQKSVVAAKLKQITGGTANYRNITDESILRKIYEAFKEDNEA